MSAHDVLMTHLNATAKALLSVDRLEVAGVVDVLRRVRERNGFVWIIGNGGSAATASHFANDLEKVCETRAIPLMELGCTISAFGNDDGWHKMFSHALEGYASQSDVLVIFSCSGFSGNVVEAAKKWNAGNALVIFTGDNRDSKLLQVASAEVVVFVNNPEIRVQESVHLALCHAIVEVLKKE